MDYIARYKMGCIDLAKAIDAYLERVGTGPTYFCVRAGVHQAALATVRKGTAKPDTVAKLRDHLEAALAREVTE